MKETFLKIGDYIICFEWDYHYSYDKQAFDKWCSLHNDPTGEAPYQMQQLEKGNCEKFYTLNRFIVTNTNPVDTSCIKVSFEINKYLLKYINDHIQKNTISEMVLLKEAFEDITN